MRTIGILWLGLLSAGCHPHQTRPLTPPEALILDDMIAFIGAHAEQSGEAMDLGVSEAIRDVRDRGAVRVFEDDPGKGHGFVVLGRLYLHHTLVRGPRDGFGLMMLYHEGVHLTQSCLRLVCAPSRAEHEARWHAQRFADRLPADVRRRLSAHSIR